MVGAAALFALLMLGSTPRREVEILRHLEGWVLGSAVTRPRLARRAEALAEWSVEIAQAMVPQARG